MNRLYKFLDSFVREDGGFLFYNCILAFLTFGGTYVLAFIMGAVHFTFIFLEPSAENIAVFVICVIHVFSIHLHIGLDEYRIKRRLNNERS